jgi:putative endonuclease
MFAPHELGRKGEDLAAELLLQKGLTILERNWRKGRTEIDIIATNGVFLIICEVKTRKNDRFGSPDESIDERKMDALAEAGAAYQEIKSLDLEFRFDVINILMDGEKLISIDHIEDAFHL